LYSPPQPDRALFHLLYRCLEPHFFQQLGFKETLANPESGRLDKNNIIEAIKAIKNKYRVQYPAFKPDGNRLEYASPVLFARSYLLMIKDLDLRLAE
jgi:hypothetical protein